MAACLFHGAPGLLVLFHKSMLVGYKNQDDCVEKIKEKIKKKPTLSIKGSSS